MLPKNIKNHKLKRKKDCAECQNDTKNWKSGKINLISDERFKSLGGSVDLFFSVAKRKRSQLMWVFRFFQCIDFSFYLYWCLNPIKTWTSLFLKTTPYPPGRPPLVVAVVPWPWSCFLHRWRWTGWASLWRQFRTIGKVQGEQRDRSVCHRHLCCRRRIGWRGSPLFPMIPSRATFCRCPAPFIGNWPLHWPPWWCFCWTCCTPR